MRKRSVWQYICEFCDKRGLSASHMTKHERHCTKNPNRICRVCEMLKDEQPSNFHPAPLSELIKLLPTPEPYEDEYGGVVFQRGFEDAIAAALPKLREATGNCPACIMAALRQAGIPVPIARDFSFKDRMKEIWADLNHAAEEREYQY